MLVPASWGSRMSARLRFDSTEFAEVPAEVCPKRGR
jgi:hypothetical protein